jgi:hypothetical protein
MAAIVNTPPGWMWKEIRWEGQPPLHDWRIHLQCICFAWAIMATGISGSSESHQLCARVMARWQRGQPLRRYVFRGKEWQV